MFDILHGIFVDPFANFIFMKRALAVSVCLSLMAPPLGIFLTLKRMSLVGDAVSHSLLPGIAIGFLWAGTPFAMAAGGLVVGFAVILLSHVIGRQNGVREETTLAVLYLFALASGVLFISYRGSQTDLVHLLFGTVLTIQDTMLTMVAIVSSVVLVCLTFGGRLLFMEGFDPLTLRFQGRSPLLIQSVFLALVVLCLVSSFQAIGTLMAVGLLIIPAATARLLSQRFLTMLVLSMALGIFSSVSGLLLSFHLNLPPGPSIITFLALSYFVSLLLGRRGQCGRGSRKSQLLLLLFTLGGLLLTSKLSYAAGHGAFTSKSAANESPPKVSTTRLGNTSLKIVTSRAGDGKLKIVTSFSILENLVSEVGGDRVDVFSLIPRNTNPHLYNPTPRDLKKLTDGQIIFINGHGFEPWFTPGLREDLNAPVLEASRGVTILKRGFTDEDPHAWQDPRNGKIYVHNIRDALTELDPARRAYYEERAQTYDEKLERLTKEFSTKFEGIPKNVKSVMTFHDAFHYLGEAFGIEFHAPVGWGGETELRTRDFANLILQIKTQNIHALFYENTTDQTMMEQIARDYKVTLGGQLVSDYLSALGSGDAPTYLDLLQKNLSTIYEALRK